VDTLSTKALSRDPKKLSHAALILTEAVYLDPYAHEYDITKNLSIPRFESYMNALRETSRAHFLSTFAEASTFAGGSARFDASLAAIARKHLGPVLNETMKQQDTLEYLYQAARAESRTQKAVGELLVAQGQRPQRPAFYH